MFGSLVPVSAQEAFNPVLRGAQLNQSLILAQESSALTAETERVIVTGSYIPTAETESALPVTVYTAEVLRKQGANTPIEGLRQLPSFVGNAATENNSNGGNGQAFINLRALGEQNVLALVNGRRAFSFSNINAIPIGALARVEVLKDGASSIYGSDAVAGVVNFVLLNGPGEKPFEGAEIDALYGDTTDSDAHVRQMYIRGGAVSNKFAIAASGEYYSRANLYARDREISASADNRKYGGRNGGSTFFPGRVTVSGVPRVLLDFSNNAPTGIQAYRAFDSANDPQKFNFRAYSPAIPAVEKAMYFVTGNYKVFGEDLQLYGDILYAKTKQDNGLAPSPFSIPLGLYVNPSVGVNSEATSRADQLAIIRNSPFNPFPGNTLTSVSYRFIQESGNRRDFMDQDYYRYVAGVKGNFFVSSWGYDVGFVYERADAQTIDSGDATRGGIYREIIAGNFNPFIGPGASVAGTVPTYVNGVPTGMTRSYDNTAAVERASYLGHSFSHERDFLYDGKLFGNLFPKLFQGGMGINLGAERRQIVTQNVPDPVEAAGDQLGFTAANRQKFVQEVDSIFGELSLPLIISTMNIPGIRSLEISGAYRYEKFEDRDQFQKSRASFNNGGNPRLSIRYQPIADLTLRASWGQSFRSPSPGNLFAPAFQDFLVLFDPLTQRTLQPRDGVFEGGNPALVPENTDTYSGGVVWTPKFVPGFTMTTDVYQVFTTDLILDSASFAQLVLTANGNSGGALFSNLVIREPGTNIPTQIFANTANAGKRIVTGLDITATYEIPTQRHGKFTVSGGYNHFFSWKVEPVAGLGTTSFLGRYNNGTLPLAPGAIPWNKGFLRGEWEWKGFDFVATGNYVGDFYDDSSFLAGAVRIGGTDTNPRYDIRRRVPSYVTFDTQLSYEWKKTAVEPSLSYAKDAKNVVTANASSASIWQRLLWGTKLTFGVNNAFDRNPPTVLGALNDNYDTSLYSVRNRYVYVSLNKKF
jgi:iron complex outermembrane recepter protein